MSENTKTSNHNLEENLFTEFPKPTAQEWRDVVEKSLKGATIEEKLVTKTYEEIALKPMYGDEDLANYPYLKSQPGEFPYVRGTNEQGYLDQAWEICQEIDCASAEEFNRVARHDLDKGQTMLKIRLNDSVETNNGNPKKGLILKSVSDFRTAFQNINLEEVPLYIETVNGGQAFFGTFIAYLQQQNYDLTKIKGCLGMDPLSNLVKDGTLPYKIENAYKMMGEITKWSVKNTPNLRNILVQSHPYHDAGGNAVHELAFAISSGLEYLREMDQQKVSLDDAASKMLFSFSIGSNFFMEIAKLRAARMIWARIIKELGGNDASQKMKIHSRTSAWTKTIYDPYVNILRGTVEAFAGVIGGTDTLHISPFDESIKPSEEFSRRIARNTHLILDKESNLSKVTDPAGGSWYIESLTYTLAEKVWELFQLIEEKGGMLKAIQFGLPQDLVSKVANEKINNIKTRKDKFIGTNIFPNLNEIPLETKGAKNSNEVNLETSKNESLEFLTEVISLNGSSVEDTIDAANNGAAIVNILHAMNLEKSDGLIVNPLTIHRGAQSYEELRQNSQKFKDTNGEFPTVFVANFGPVAAYKPRTDFVTDFFEVGGFKVLQNKGFTSIDEIVDAFKNSESTIVVVCSTDDQYSENVPTICKQIKGQNPNTKILLAGKPSIEEMDLFKQYGIDDFINMTVNNFETLVNLQQNGGFMK
ncbi:methylmalonyl-CoA mutase family protein [Bacillus sp. AFS017336]|uniref:methylmalonyl-CoA mutase family protein n=1 Tax=Bacillus sp. AFS017336 TaxID=2033489 RepID=UPI000BF07E00|nr:methylmalonyl-CoA mutase family protein [Bacillus sp. AFS017336]PEK98988.1 methylmalonyl-CoA mutase [Bacillus sp. AFS017336]